MSCLLRNVVARGLRSLASAQAMEPSISKRLWQQSKREAMVCLYHPFVVSIAAGTLDLHSFQRFIAQDSFFLTAFAKAYGLAIERSDDREVKSEICKLQQAVYEELELHSSLMKAWNFDHTPPSPATCAYTDFLLAVAAGKKIECEKTKVPMLALAAMAPCMRLYAFLGQETRVFSRENHPYRDWISTYSSPGFETAATRLEQLLDSLSEAQETTAAEFQSMQSLYHRAIAYEVSFFDAQEVRGSNAFVPLLESVALKDRNFVLISDFDSTCTVSDSSPVLAELAMAVDPNVRRKWSSLSDEYFRDYSKLLEEVVLREYDYDAIKEALQVLSEFEKQGNAKIDASRVLQGIKIDDIKQAGQNMALQAGCASVLCRLSSKISCQILSVCWSRTFIEAAFSKENITNVPVHSNELENDGNFTTGSLIRRVETPIDKEETMFREILHAPDDKFVIFIGDSLTDLLALLRADIGIVLGTSSSLDRASKAFGVKIVPLFSGLVQRQQSSRSAWRKEEGVLYRASGWLEIEAFLAGN
ncbi:hypothetical protein SELMODRAFT_185239 [Selaginella moellendorffii]|uniref:Thiaminase-2/PQQC domain-containing protein n=1 Tax=Selaginella moellendorffii TaxID=88036 RepID=D8T432_SELML|nr:hypothetical protein SELMODRAFT_185239 [Selaginella moellendorffii]